MPKVSIILPTYNRADFIAEAIESAINQTFEDWELLIIDDGSTDNTAEIVSKYLKDKRIKYFKTKNRGTAAARNRGLKLATGEYTAFLDSDDLWNPAKLKKQVEILDTHPDIDLLFTSSIIKNKHGEEVLYHKKMLGYGLKGKVLIQSLLQDSISIMPTTVLLRWTKYHIYFDEKLKRTEDTVFFMELGLLGAVFYGLQFPSAIINRGHNSIVANRLALYKDALRIVNIVLSKGYDLHFDVNIAKSYLYLSVARNILWSSVLRNQIGTLKKYNIYLNTLFKAICFYPGYVLIYKHIIRDLPKELITAICIKKGC